MFPWLYFGTVDYTGDVESDEKGSRDYEQIVLLEIGSLNKTTKIF
jgi:hypothetical protein